MVTRCQVIKNDTKFLEINHINTEMNSLDEIMWDIFDLFDDIFFELEQIQLAINLDDLEGLLLPSPPREFDPFQTIGKY